CQPRSQRSRRPEPRGIEQAEVKPTHRHDHRNRLCAAHRGVCARWRNPGRSGRSGRRIDHTGGKYPIQWIDRGPGRRPGEPMTEFLQSIKTDLLSRRLLPFVALLGVALIAAVAYTVAGGSGGSGSTPVASAPSAPSGSVPVLPVSVAPATSNEAVSETPGGVRYQSQGPTRDPFTPLPSPSPAKTAKASSSSSGSSGKSGESSSSGSSSGGTGTGPSSGGSGAAAPKAPAPAPKKPAKPQLDYDVSVLFG